MATKKKKAGTPRVEDKDKGKVAKSQKSLKKKVEAEAKGQAPEISEEEIAEANRLLALLETGFLAVAADGEIDQAEFDNLGQNFANWTGDLNSEELHAMLQAFSGYLDEDGLEGRLAFISGILDPESKRLAFTFAAGLAMVDGEANDDEMGVLGDIAEAFGIPEDEAQATFDTIAAELEG